LAGRAIAINNNGRQRGGRKIPRSMIFKDILKVVMDIHRWLIDIYGGLMDIYRVFWFTLSLMSFAKKVLRLKMVFSKQKRY
jgi:hypothetical protein